MKHLRHSLLAATLAGMALAAGCSKSGGGGEKSTPIDRVEVESVTIVPAAA